MIQVPVPHGRIHTLVTATIWINPLQVQKLISSWEFTRENPWPSEQWVDGVPGFEGWVIESLLEYDGLQTRRPRWKRRKEYECLIVWVGQSDRANSTTVSLSMETLAREIDAWFRSIGISQSTNG